MFIAFVSKIFSNYLLTYNPVQKYFVKIKKSNKVM